MSIMRRSLQLNFRLLLFFELSSHARNPCSASNVVSCGLYFPFCCKLVPIPHHQLALSGNTCDKNRWKQSSPNTQHFCCFWDPSLLKLCVQSYKTLLIGLGCKRRWQIWVLGCPPQVQLAGKARNVPQCSFVQVPILFPLYTAVHILVAPSQQTTTCLAVAVVRIQAPQQQFVMP